MSDDEQAVAADILNAVMNDGDVVRVEGERVTITRPGMAVVCYTVAAENPATFDWRKALPEGDE